MSKHLDAIARARLEAEFGSHAGEVLDSGAMPHLQLRLQEVTPSTPQRGWRPEYGDPDSYLEAVYHCIQQ